MKDIDQYKAVVAAKAVMERCPGVNITTSTEPCQNYDDEFYKQFQVIIGGLDNVDARRWLNMMVHSIVEWDGDEPEVSTMFIDGGTEGFQGQARVIHPFKTACYECTIDQLPPDDTYPLCTIKETPRLPEHCIQYAYMIEWEKAFPNKKMDKDNPEDMQWVCNKAQERAD